MTSYLGESFIGSGENLPRVGEGDAGVEEIEQCRFGIGVGGRVEAVGNIAVLKLLEGYEVGGNDAGIL